MKTCNVEGCFKMVVVHEPSSDYFALAQGKRSKRGVTCVRIGDGVWSDIEIL